MNKWVTGFSILFAAAIGGNVLKIMYEVYTNTTSGVLITNGVDELTRSVFSSLPWLAPAVCFIYVVIIWARPNDPRNRER